MELVKQVEVNIDYILMLVAKYHQSNCEDKEILGTIDKAIKSSLALRSKKELIDGFISKINADTNVMDDWGKFVKEQKEIDLKKIINDENMNEEETRKFLDNAFRDGQVKTSGTDIEKILPPMRRLGGGNRTEYERVFEIMKRHPNYICDYDDEYDNTYAYIEFSVPDKYKSTAQHMKPDKEPLTVWEQFQDHMKKSRENPNGPEAQKDALIAEQIMKAMENPNPGINFIGL